MLIGILAVSYVLALFLLRHPNTLWPAYALASLTIVNLIAAVFSRGAAIEAIVPVTVFAVLGWVAWSVGLAKAMNDHPGWQWVAVILWALAIAYASLVGWYYVKKDAPFRLLGITLLICLTFAFGAWGLLVANIEYRIDYSWITGFFFLAIALSPLLLTARGVVWGQYKHQQDDWRWLTPKRASELSREGRGYALLTQVSVYLTILQYIVRSVIALLDRLPQWLLGLPPTRVAYPSWFALLAWKTEISAFLLAGGAACVLAWAISEVFQRRNLIPSTWLPFFGFLACKRLRINSKLTWPIEFQRIGSFAIKLTLFCLWYLLQLASTALFNVSLVIAHLWAVFGESFKRLAIAWLIAFRRLVIPVACFSGASLLLMVMISTVLRYDSKPAHWSSAFTLWLEVAFGAGLMLLLFGCGSFGVAPDHHTDRHSLGESFSRAAEESRRWVVAVVPMIGFLILLVGLPSALFLFVEFLIGLCGAHLSPLGTGPLQSISVSVTAVVLMTFEIDGMRSPDPPHSRVR